MMNIEVQKKGVIQPDSQDRNGKRIK